MWSIKDICDLTLQFTGWKDPDLTDLGKQEALKGGEELKKYGYVSITLHVKSTY